MKKSGTKIESEKNKEVSSKNLYLYFLLFCLLLTTHLVISPQAKANQSIPNDPLYAEQWNLHSYSEAYGTNWEAAYNLINQVDKVPKQETITVVVFDSGLNINHPDLKDSVWTNPNETIDGKDNDNNGYTDDIHGCAFTQADTSCLDVNQDTSPTQHGTGTTSVIAGKINNNQGLVGMSHGFDVQIIPVKINNNGIVNFSDVREGLDYIQALIDNGIKIDVVNMSFAAWPINPEGIADINEQITYLTNQGIVFVAGSGNSANTENGVGWPANHSDVIAVGGYGPDGKRAESASFGNELDITAPSIDIKTACYQDSYCTQSGTSFSGPEAAAAVALIKAYRPEAIITDVRELLRQTSGKPFSPEYGYGPLNFQAIAMELLLERKVYLPITIN